jgi:hypothetical protein
LYNSLFVQTLHLQLRIFFFVLLKSLTWIEWSRIPRKNPKVKTVISAKRFFVMFQPSRLRPCATRIFESRWAGVDITLFVTIKMFSRLMNATKYGTAYTYHKECKKLVDLGEMSNCIKKFKS